MKICFNSFEWLLLLCASTGSNIKKLVQDFNLVTPQTIVAENERLQKRTAK
jgi:hypothetical protein